MAIKRSHLAVRKLTVETAAIPHGSLVKFGSTDEKVVLASAATDNIIGVAYVAGDPLTASAAVGSDLDIVTNGVAEVKLGGNVTRGARLTANSSGQAISTTTTGNALIGMASVSGVSGDIGYAFVNPSVL